MDIKRHEDYKTPVNVQDIHGKFPYKLYAEVIGTKDYGEYIVVVSDTPFIIGEHEMLRLHFINGESEEKKLKTQVRTKSGTITGSGMVARRMVSRCVEYKAKQVNMVILKRAGIKVTVYKAVHK